MLETAFATECVLLVVDAVFESSFVDVSHSKCIAASCLGLFENWVVQSTPDAKEVRNSLGFT